VFFILPSDSKAVEQIAWQKYTPEIVTGAGEKGMPVMIDFYADWCIPCKELDKFTFSDQRVQKLSEQMITIKADLTHFQNDETLQLREKYNIKGVPTIVFLDENGREITALRLIGYEDADNFVLRMQKVLK